MSQGLLLATHEREEGPHYWQGLLLLQDRPPFSPRAQSARYRFEGADERTRAALAEGFHFVNGLAVRDGTRAVFSVGLNDSAALLLSAPLADVLRLLRPL